jgi:PAS domain S-box-containing protein
MIQKTDEMSTVLINDDRQQLHDLSAILQAEGYYVTAFTSTTQALTAMRQNTPNLVIIERKQANGKIPDSIQKYRLFVESLQEGIWAVDEQACTTFVNPHMARMLGYTPEEMLGKSILQFTDKPEVEKCKLFLRPRPENARQYCDLAFLHKNGGRIYVTGDAVPLRDDTNKLIGTLVAISDITSRKKMENKLLRLRTAVEQAVDGIAVADLGGFIQFANLSWGKMHGYPVGELAGKHMRIFHTEAQFLNEVIPFNEEVLKKGFHEGELWHVRRDGSTFPSWMTVALLLNAEQTPVGLVCMMHDITERKQAEEALRRAKEDWERTFDSVPDMICILDANYTITRINRAMAENLGLSPEEAVGRRCYACMHHGESPPAFCPHAKLLQDGLAHAVETRDERSGEWLYISVSPVRDPQGKIIGAVHVVRNITERKKAEEERLKLLAGLRRSNADLAQFASVTSHDLQEPLRMVNHFVQLLQRRCSNVIDAQANEYIAFIVDSVTRMQTLITDLLQLGRGGSNSGKAVMVDAGAAVKDALKNIHKAVLESGAQITIAPLPSIWITPTELCQVFQNLIANAVKFRRDEPLFIHVGAKELENAWEFSVSDNGIGFNPKHAARIFEPFERLHSAQEYQGSGIGLATCKKIVERHGGTIRAESTPGQGSVFSFTIPKKNPSVAVSPPAGNPGISA